MVSPTSQLAGAAAAVLLSCTLVLQAGAASAGMPATAGDVPESTQPAVQRFSPVINPIAEDTDVVPPSVSQAHRAGTTSSTDEAKILQMVNSMRLDACIPIVRRNSQLDAIARNWSREMAKHQWVDTNPSLEDALPAGWMGGNEVVAAGYPSGQATMSAWAAEPKLRAAIIDPTLTDAGIGFIRTTGDPHGTWATLDLVQYPEASSTFLDVRGWHQFHKEIQWMATTGISRGTACGSEKVFAPNAGTTREAMAAFLYRAAGSPRYIAPLRSAFTDVSTSHKFYKEISWLASRGISGGWTINGKREFRPALNITREAMAAFLYRMAGKPSVALPSAPLFTDVPRTSTFYKEITWMAKAGISTGWASGGKKEFRRFVSTERAAMAAFLYRYKN